MDQYSGGELDRRLANLIRYGTIKSLDEAKALVKVDLGDIVTDWLPWATGRAGGDRTWHAPEVGEQVILLSPSGELSSGIVHGSVFQDAYPANAALKTVQRVTFADGTIIEYDRAAHQLKVDSSASNGSLLINAGSGSVTINCNSATVNAASSVTLNTPATHCTGNLQVDGSATISGATSCNAGLSVVSGGAGAAATITGSIAITSGNVSLTGGEISADGIGLKSHHHTAQGMFAATTAAQA